MSRNVSSSLTRGTSESSTYDQAPSFDSRSGSGRGGRGQGRYVPPALRARLDAEAKRAAEDRKTSSPRGADPSSDRDFPSLKEVHDALPADREVRRPERERSPPRNNDRWKRDDEPGEGPRDFRDSRERGGYDRDHRGGGGGGYDRDHRGGGGGGGFSERRYGGGGSGFSERRYGGGGGGGGGGRRWERDEPNPFENQPEETGALNFDSYDEIPVETSGTRCPEPIHTFAEMPLAPRLKVNIELARYTRPTPVQKYSIPVALEDRDLMGCAQTGSGKTAAFLFPIISRLIQNPPEHRYDGSTPMSRRKAFPACLVLAPTRELATQIHEEARKFCWKTGIRAVVCYGGAPISQQLHEIEQGCHILVATPGRLVDILERGRASLSQIQFLVLDEADRMLDMGFEPQIRRIVETEDMPFTGRRRTFMFSATFPREIQHLASEFLEDYIFLRIGRVGSTTELVTQKFLQVNEDDKRECLVDLLSSVDGLTLIFVETKRAADSLEHYLCNQGFPAISIHGDRTQTEREMALAAFKAGERPFLIATNVASRGLDIRGVVHVMNYDMPNDIDEYVHRIGRTGRAGATGLATSFISEQNKNIARDLIELLAETKQEIPQWLQMMTGFSGRGFSGGRGGGRGAGGDRRFGARDYRQGSQTRRYDAGNRGGGGSGGSFGGSGGSYAPGTVSTARSSYSTPPPDSGSSWWKD